MLHPRKKIKKQEIKEDKLVTLYFQAQRWLSRFSKYIQIGGIVVAALVVLAVLMVRSKRQAEAAAAGKLGTVIPSLYAGGAQQAIPELEKIVTSYAGTPSAGTAAFYLANSYFAMGNFTQAEKYYRLIIDKYTQNRWFIASSLSGQAACLEARNEWLQAAALYEKAARSHADLFSAPFYLKDAGRCYMLANNKTKAREVYQIVLEKFPESSPAQEIQVAIESL
jgi:tetratricopeptide (TPR) repeat protein